MSKPRSPSTSQSAGMLTRDQVSAGGVAYRPHAGGPEIALILVAARDQPRWQLPKGAVDPGESPEMAALREVREEAGIETELVQPLETIEYWYVGRAGPQRIRFHKFVHFFLLRYRSGDVALHDDEVLEARWIPMDEAVELLAFPSEQKVVQLARERLGEDG